MPTNSTEGKRPAGRPKGFSPIHGEDGAMVQKSKAFSMPADDWLWLEAQPNQSKTIREAIAEKRSRSITARK